MGSKSVLQNASYDTVMLDLPNGQVFVIGAGAIEGGWQSYWFELFGDAVMRTGLGPMEADRYAAVSGCVAALLRRARQDEDPWGDDGID